MPAITPIRRIDKTAVLSQCELFSNLGEELLRKIAGLAVTRSLHAGQVLYSEHQEASGIFIVARGELRSIRQNSEGREQVLSTERTGRILAAVPVFNGGKFFSTMIADTDADLLCLERHVVHQLCREHSEILWNLARVLAHRVRHLAGLVESLALRNVEQRVAHYVATIARERGIAIDGGCVVELKLTRTQIASRLGSAREVISRAFAHLQKSGLIEVKGRKLVIVRDVTALEVFAGIEEAEVRGEPVSDLTSDLA